MGGAMDDVYLTFTKAFDTVSYKIPKYKQSKCTMRKTEKWMGGWVQRIVISCTKSLLLWPPGADTGADTL